MGLVPSHISGRCTSTRPLEQLVCSLRADARVLVRTHGDPDQTARAVAERAAVYGCQRITGDHDLFARIRAADETLLATEVDHIRRHPQVEGVQVIPTVTTVLDQPTAAGTVEASKLDALDDLEWDLLEQTAAPASSTSAPPSGCRRRRPEHGS